MRECDFYGVEIVGGGRRRGGEGEEKGRRRGSHPLSPRLQIRLLVCGYIRPEAKFTGLQVPGMTEGVPGWGCRVGGPLALPWAGVPDGRSPRSAPGWGCRVGGPLALPRAGVPGGRSPVPRVAPAICSTCIHASFLYVGVASPHCLHCMRALISRARFVANPTTPEHDNGICTLLHPRPHCLLHPLHCRL